MTDAELARHLAHGWEDPALPDDLAALEALLHLGREPLLHRLGVPEDVRARFLPPPAADCGVERLSQMTGQHFSALDGVALPGPLRVLHPMQAITTEFSPQRLNVRVDDAGRIRALTCG